MNGLALAGFLALTAVVLALTLALLLGLLDASLGGGVGL